MCGRSKVAMKRDMIGKAPWETDWFARIFSLNYPRDGNKSFDSSWLNTAVLSSQSIFRHLPNWSCTHGPGLIATDKWEHILRLHQLVLQLEHVQDVRLTDVSARVTCFAVTIHYLSHRSILPVFKSWPQFRQWWWFIKNTWNHLRTDWQGKN